MKIKIENVVDKGNLDRERVLLKVLSNEDLKNYVIMDSTFNSEGDISNTGRHAFKFPMKEVKKGDYICLFTKKMDTTSKSEFANSIGSITHCFFWNREASVWNKNNDNCYLLYIVDSKNV